jgi:histidine ammonia-lyase
LKPTAGVKAAYDTIRVQVPFAKEDRIFAKDVEKIRGLILNGELVRAVEKVTGVLELISEK